MDKHAKFMKAMQELKILESEYLEKFGDDSLEHVILYDPLGISNYPEEVYEAADRLAEAIENDSPLENLPPEVEVIY